MPTTAASDSSVWRFPMLRHDMVLDACDRRFRIGRRCEIGAELRLSALALGNHDQPLGDLERRFRAVPLPDERQAQVDPRSHTRPR